MARILITMGLVILITGLLWHWVSNLGLGKLPGDIVLEKGKVKCYAPITTSLLLSILLSLISWLLQKL